MAKLEDIGPAVIVKNGKAVYIEMTPEEKQKRLDEINKAEEELAKEEEKAAKKEAALEKLKTNKDYEDLLIALGLDS